MKRVHIDTAFNLVMIVICAATLLLLFFIDDVQQAVDENGSAQVAASELDEAGYAERDKALQVSEQGIVFAYPFSWSQRGVFHGVEVSDEWTELSIQNTHSDGYDFEEDRIKVMELVPGSNERVEDVDEFYKALRTSYDVESLPGLVHHEFISANAGLCEHVLVFRVSDAEVAVIELQTGGARTDESLTPVSCEELESEMSQIADTIQIIR